MALSVARARRVHIPPRKMRLVADLIRGKKVSDARDILVYSPASGDVVQRRRRRRETQRRRCPPSTTWCAMVQTPTRTSRFVWATRSPRLRSCRQS